jgi:hypothetical protein
MFCKAGIFGYFHGMGDSVTPGMGGRGPTERRIAAIERFLGRFSKRTIFAKNGQGNPQGYQVLAILGAPGKIDPTSGAFWGLYTGEGNKTFLQGGTVSGGSGAKTIEDIAVVSGSIRPNSMDGKLLWVEITGTGLVVDDVLLPGFDITGANCSATSTTGDNLPDPTLPTKDSPRGRICVEIGRWTTDNFTPSQIGNIGIGFCPGNFNVSR